MSVRTARNAKKWSKEDFLKRVMSGGLSTDRALARLTEQLHQYENTSENTICGRKSSISSSPAHRPKIIPISSPGRSVTEVTSAR
jgi:hypothetical protein